MNDKKWVLMLMLTLGSSQLQAFSKAPQTLAEKSDSKNICIVTLDTFNSSQLDTVQRGIKYLYGFNAVYLGEYALPKSTYYPARGRYRADLILKWGLTQQANWLNTAQKKESDLSCFKYIALTQVDISTTMPQAKDWGVLGLGYLGGNMAMVSTFRMHTKFQGKPATKTTINRRLVKVVNHEIGHMLGIPHVKDPQCLMQSAEGSIQRVDSAHGLLCTASEDFIQQKYGIKLPKYQSFDWRVVD